MDKDYGASQGIFKGWIDVFCENHKKDYENSQLA